MNVPGHQQHDTNQTHTIQGNHYERRFEKSYTSIGVN